MKQRVERVVVDVLEECAGVVDGPDRDWRSLPGGLPLRDEPESRRFPDQPECEVVRSLRTLPPWVVEWMHGAVEVTLISWRSRRLGWRRCWHRRRPGHSISSPLTAKRKRCGDAVAGPRSGPAC